METARLKTKETVHKNYTLSEEALFFIAVQVNNSERTIHVYYNRAIK